MTNSEKIRKICEENNLGKRDISLLTKIPVDTVRCWFDSRRNPADYIVDYISLAIEVNESDNKRIKINRS